MASKKKSGKKEKKQKSAQTESKGERRKPMLRAIRVTPGLLTAAKEYKKAKGVSFYQLGLEAISDRLMKEGFLKASEADASAQDNG